MMLPSLGSQLFPGRGYSTRPFGFTAFQRIVRRLQVPGQMSTGSKGWWTTRSIHIADSAG